MEHHPFRHCLSRIFTSDDVQFTLYSTLYSGRFQRKFCESRLKVGTIPYRTVRMTSREGAQRTGSGNESNCDLDRGRSVWHHRRLWHLPVQVLPYALFYLTKSSTYTFSYESIIILISSFDRCSCILTRMRKYAAALFLVVVVVDSWYVIEEEDLCLLCVDFPVD